MFSSLDQAGQDGAVPELDGLAGKRGRLCCVADIIAEQRQRMQSAGGTAVGGSPVHPLGAGQVPQTVPDHGQVPLSDIIAEVGGAHVPFLRFSIIAGEVPERRELTHRARITLLGSGAVQLFRAGLIASLLSLVLERLQDADVAEVRSLNGQEDSGSRVAGGLAQVGKPTVSGRVAAVGGFAIQDHGRMRIP